MSDPKWYDRLSHDRKDAVDQALHFLMGLAFSAVGTAAAAWAFFHWREFFQQAPIQRVYDTERDMRFGLFGAVLGQGLQLGWLAVLASAVF